MTEGSYSISDIQDYHEYIIKKHETMADNPRVQIYTNKIKSRIVFKIKTDYKLELLSPETIKLLESTKKDVDRDKDGEDVTKLESFEFVLVYCDLVNNNHQQASEVLSIFVTNKQIDQSITIAPHSLTMLNSTNTELLSIKVWFIDQDSKPLEIEDNVNMTLIIE